MAFIPNPLIIPVGLIIGILISTPLGPVNLLCLQRAVERGFWGGLAAGLGTLLGDGLIALCAALGVNAVSGAIRHHRFAIQLIGGMVLIISGLRLFFTEPRLIRDSALTDERGSLADFVWDIPKTFFLTITNPGAVLGLFAIFGGVGSFVEVDGYIDAFTMVAAVMGGSLIWWISASNFIGVIRHRLDLDMLRLINRVAGTLLAGFGGLLLTEVAIKGLPPV
jgi:threonine/homoserine/homoserine lactone efflux protein